MFVVAGVRVTEKWTSLDIIIANGPCLSLNYFTVKKALRIGRELGSVLTNSVELSTAREATSCAATR
jgi:hypothetical protein